MSRAVATQQVHLPVRATVNESFQLITACTIAETISEPVAFDASGTTVFGPLGVTLLAASIAVRQAAGLTTELVLPGDESALAFVKEVGLDRFAQGKAPRPGTLELLQMSALDAIYTDRVLGILVRGVPGITEDNGYPIQLCLNELLQNVFEWSESSIGGAWLEDRP